MQTSQSITHQESGGLADAITQPPTKDDRDFGRLDWTVDRYRLLLLAKRVGKQAGFTPRMLQLLEYYVAYTTAADWEEGSRPIVFQSLARTAMDLGVGERQIQKLEKRLFDIGAIAWNDSGNHKRFGRRDPRTGRLVFAYGVDLTPLAYLRHELEAKLHEKQLYAEAWRATKRDISETRRRIRDLLSRGGEEGASGERMQRFEQSYGEIAYELRSHLDLARMRHLATLHRKLHDELNKALGEGVRHRSPQPKPSTPIAPTTRTGSRRHGHKVAHLEHTIPSKKRKEEGAGEIDRRPTAVEQKAIGSETPQQLARQATDAMRAHLPLNASRLTWNDLLEAAYRRRTELRISQASWVNACRTLGRRTTVIAMVITDRAAHRSDRPVRRPPAYFCAVVRKLATGKLITAPP